MGVIKALDSKRKIIFIHSLFRTGSTYFWSLFKKDKNSVSYYEPLNEQLLGDLSKIDSEIIETNRHSGLVDDYFYEYLDMECNKKYLNNKLILEEFCEVKSEIRLKKYIDCLLFSNDAKIKVLQFNRTSLRSSWFSSNYKDSVNLYIYRRCLDQWRSILDQYKAGNYYFLCVNLLCISKNIESKYFLPLSDIFHCPDIPTYVGDNEMRCFEHDYNFIYNYVPYLTIEEHYLVHYYLWKISLLYNSKKCIFCVDMTKLNDNKCYRKEISSYFYDKFGCKLSFEDMVLPNYESYCIDIAKIREIEDIVDREIGFIEKDF